MTLYLFSYCIHPVFSFLFSLQEKVEVDRYMRELEKTFIEKKRKELAEKHHHEELTEFQNVVAPAMAEVQHLLEQNGDKVSEKGLEALVNWKLGIAK